MKVQMYARRCVEQFADICQSNGVLDALKYLNDGVPHRFTGVYELRTDSLKNVALVDKEGELRPDFLSEVPFVDSFCQFAVRDGLFRTADSTADARLDGHPYQGVVISYHGAPILWRREVWGTMCHFDLVNRPLHDDEFELLKAAANAWPNLKPSGHSGAIPLDEY